MLSLLPPFTTSEHESFVWSLSHPSLHQDIGHLCRLLWHPYHIPSWFLPAVTFISHTTSGHGSFVRSLRHPLPNRHMDHCAVTATHYNIETWFICAVSFVARYHIRTFIIHAVLQSHYHIRTWITRTVMLVAHCYIRTSFIRTSTCHPSRPFTLRYHNDGLSPGSGSDWGFVVCKVLHF